MKKLRRTIGRKNIKDAQVRTRYCYRTGVAACGHGWCLFDVAYFFSFPHMHAMRFFRSMLFSVVLSCARPATNASGRRLRLSRPRTTPEHAILYCRIPRAVAPEPCGAGTAIFYFIFIFCYVLLLLLGYELDVLHRGSCPDPPELGTRTLN